MNLLNKVLHFWVFLNNIERLQNLIPILKIFFLIVTNLLIVPHLFHRAFELIRFFLTFFIQPYNLNVILKSLHLLFNTLEYSVWHLTLLILFRRILVHELIFLCLCISSTFCYLLWLDSYHVRQFWIRVVILFTRLFGSTVNLASKWLVWYFILRWTIYFLYFNEFLINWRVYLIFFLH